MVYLIRRSSELDNSKAEHKKSLKAAVDDKLRTEFASMGVDYCSDALRFGSYGKPYLKNSDNIFFNISHCTGLAAAVIENCEAGIDAENIRQWHPRVAKRVFSERELTVLDSSDDKDEMFFRIWTLKESFVKAIGIGISYPLKTCEFIIDDDKIRVYGCDGYSFSQIVLNEQFVCSLCVKKSCDNSFYRIRKEEESFQLELK
ncbi:MAG: 4'-phosphopantetheinyl transferase family protein [Porcipelethomonas sp.]